MKKQTALFFYFLGAYVVAQFTWWGYHLIDLSSQLYDTIDQSNKMIMIIGEGSVFFLILLFGLWKIRQSIQNDILVSKRQNDFLLSVTHELKTPLTSNKLLLQTLFKRDSLEREKQKSLITQAIQENNRLEEMIENILTAARIENHRLNLNLEHIDLSNEIKRIVANWSSSRVEIDLAIEENVMANVDLFVIETVLSNLLDNALKYAGKGASIEVYLYQKEGKIVWGVKDNGIGIPPQYKSDIFNKFVRIGNEETRLQKGTGLGLFIVKNLILMHGDQISYLANTPRGAHFKITRKNGK